MTLFDFGELNEAFGSMPGDPNWNPDADLDGDDEVSLYDFGILTVHFGLIGAEEFAGSAQSASGVFSATLHVVLGDWTASTERPVYVVLQFKRAGTEGDTGTPIYEQSVTFSQGEVEKDVQVHLPAGIYTVRGLAYNDQAHTDVSHWLRSELTGFVVPSGGGSARNVVPAPAWAEEVIPADSVPSGGMGPSSASRVNLASGAYEHVPPADLEVPNPFGPPVAFARRYSSWMAQAGISSPGLGVGWKHSLDLFISWDRISNPTTATLFYPNGATESLGVTQQGSAYRLAPPEGAPYAGLAEPDNNYPGGWRITLFYRDYSRLVFAPVSNQTLTIFRLVGMIDRAGNAVGLFYQNGLLRYVRAGDTNLLELVYDGNGMLAQAKAYEAGTNNYATVTYTHQQLDDGNRHLVQVSQVNAPASLRWGFGYGYMWTRQDNSQVRLLTHVGAPDPRGGGGVLTVPIAYDSNGMVQMLMDANGHARRYVYQSNGTTDVEVYNSSTSELDFGWTQKLGVAGVNGGIVDALSHQSQLVYTNTYLPTSYTNRNGQTLQTNYDQYGNPTVIIAPRNIRTVINYTYPADYPISPVQQIEVRQIGANGTAKTSTIYTFYTPAEEVLQVPGAKAGLLKEVQSPRPGSPGERVSTRYYYTSQGNLAVVEAPGANDAGRKQTTVYFYNRDPFTGENFVSLLGRPVAVAVYDETIANVWGEYQYWLQNRNDAFWTQPPRRLIFHQHYRYDLLGRLQAIIDAAGNVTSFTYNEANQLATVTYPPVKDATGTWVTTKEQYVYWPSAGGQLKQVLAFANNVSFRVVNVDAGAEGEQKGTSGASVQPIQLGYDAQYRPIGVADGRGNATTLGYTRAGFPNLKQYPLGDVFQWYYAPVNQQSQWWGEDKEGNPIARLDANGVLARYVRAAEDSRLLRVEYYSNPYDPNSLISSETVYIGYDEFNRISQLINAQAQIDYTYDDNDLLMSVTTTYPAPVGSKTISYQYYPDGSRKSMSVPDVGTFNYYYYYTDGSGTMRVMGSVVRVTCPPTWTPHPNISCNYDQAGRLRRETNGGVRTDYDYYPRGLLSRQVSYVNASGQYYPIAIFAQLDESGQPTLDGIFYDAAGNRTRMDVTTYFFYHVWSEWVHDWVRVHNLNISGWVEYTYDVRDRLTGETFTIRDEPLFTWYSDQYTYDSADNPTSIHGSSYTYNANSQVNSVLFHYDDNGNATLFRGLAVGFDLENRTVQLPDLYRGGNYVITSRYRPDGLQAWRQDDLGRVYFLYDGTRLVAEYSASDGSLLQHFAYSAEGLNQRRGNQHRLFTFDPDGNLVHRILATDDLPGSPAEPITWTGTWHNRMGIVCQDIFSRSGAPVTPVSAGTVGYQGYFGVYSDPDTRTVDQDRYAVLATWYAGRYYDAVTAQGMQRDFGAVNPYTRLYRQGGSLADRLTNLVLSWADAGWTAGDPSAAEGAAFVKAVGALQRTIGAAWEIHAIASLPRLVGAVGTSLLSAADEFAGAGVRLASGRTTLGQGIRAAEELAGKSLPRTRFLFASAADNVPRRIYSARVLVRMAEEPGPMHNFPMSFDDIIFQQGQRTVVRSDYVLYSLRGTVNGRAGTYEIGVRPSPSGRNEVILHRFFRPDVR